jgi:hypothetical protein
LEAGVFFPTTPCGSNKFPNHRKLATACFDLGHSDDSFSALKLNENNFESWSSATLDNIKSELLASKADRHILSSEHFSSRLLSSAEINRLYDFLSSVYSTIDVIIYFRRQDEYAISSYSTLLKSGGVSSRILPEGMKGLDYFKICNDWSTVFGDKSLNVNIFNRSCLLKGDIVHDFMNKIDVDVYASNYAFPVKDSNPSITSKAQRALILANLLYVEGVVSNKVRQDFISYLEVNYPGKSRLPARHFVKQWFEKFNNSNSMLFDKYFLNIGGFGDDFSKYPVEWDDVKEDSLESSAIFFGFINSIYVSEGIEND